MTMKAIGSVLTWTDPTNSPSTSWRHWVGGRFLLANYPDGAPRVYEMHIDDDGEPQVKSLGTYAEYIEARRAE